MNSQAINQDQQARFDKFVENNLANHIKKSESERQSAFEKSKFRKIIASLASFVFLVIFFDDILKVNKINILHAMEQIYGNWNLSYQQWYFQSSNIAQFLLPEKIFILNIFSPTIILLLIVLITWVWTLRPSIIYVANKYDLNRANVIIEMTKFVFDSLDREKINLINHTAPNELAENLILPIFDKMENDEICNFILEGCLVNIYESKLWINEDKKSFMSFQGIVAQISSPNQNEQDDNPSLLFTESSNVKNSNFFLGKNQELERDENIRIFNKKPPLQTDLIKIFHKNLIENAKPFKMSNFEKFVNYFAGKTNMTYEFINDNANVTMQNNLEILFHPKSSYVIIPTNHQIFSRNLLTEPQFSQEDLATFWQILELVKKITLTMKNN